MIKKIKRFLVTGGAGFIGSHIVERLVDQGHFVRVLDNFSSGRKENLAGCSNFELIKGDIRSPSACAKACRGMDFVLHQAALRSVPKSMSEPALYNEVNIGGTLNMLSASHRSKIRHFVFASSSSVYGDIDTFPEREDFSPQPISPYALTKLAGEYYCRIYSLHYSLATTCLRYFNVFGERQSLDDEYAVVVPKFIDSILKGKSPPIYGTGLQSRDFTHVCNVVSANLLAVKRPCSQGDIFNVASGRAHSVLELVGALNRLTGKNIRPVFLKKRPGDVFKTHADILRARRLLGYRPEVNFQKGLELTLRFFRQKLESR